MTDIARRNQPPMLHGTLSTFRRRCGKPGCHCAEGAPHESPAFLYREGGRTKTLTLTQAELEWVEAGIERYQQASAELEAHAREGLAALAARRERSRR